MPYSNRSAVASTRHGDDYQVLILMYFALKYIEQCLFFHIQTECSEYGKFDDIIIKTGAKLIVGQIKHHINEGQYTLGDFITNKSSKVRLDIYFDSVFEWLSKNDIIKACEFHFYSNWQLPSELVSYVNLETRQLNESFFTSSAYSVIYNAILCNSKFKETLSSMQLAIQRQLINQFLCSLRLDFGLQNRQQLEITIKSMVKHRYHTTNDALFYAFYHEFDQWFISPHPADRGDKDIRKLFEDWYTRFVFLERLCGFTQYNLDQSDALPEGKMLERNGQTEWLENLLNDKSASKNVFILSGVAGVGKTTLIKSFLRKAKFDDGELLLITVDQFKAAFTGYQLSPELSQTFPLKCICIDNAEKLLYDKDLCKQVLEFAQKLNGLNKKIIFNVRLSSATILSEQLSNHGLRPEIITLPKLQPSELENYKIYLAVQHNFVLCEILSVPFYLSLATKQRGNLTTLSQREISAEELKQLLISSYFCKTSEGLSFQDQETFLRQRRAILRELVFLKAKKKPKVTNTDFNRFSDEFSVTLKSLVSDDILTDSVDNIDFKHPLYEEWSIKQIFDALLDTALESHEDTLETLTTFMTQIPRHHYTYILLKETNTKFQCFLERTMQEKFDRRQVEPFNDRFRNLMSGAYLSKNETFLAIAYDAIYVLSLHEPANCVDALIFISNNYEKEVLRGNNKAIDCLSRLSNFEVSFESAMDILFILTNPGYDFTESHDQDHIQYIINTHFYPFQKPIDILKRLDYLKTRSREEDKQDAVLKVIYQIFTTVFYCSVDTLSSKIDDDSDTKYIMLEDTDIDNYVMKMLDIILCAANQEHIPEYLNQAEEILLNIIELYSNSILFEEFNRKVIITILQKMHFEEDYFYFKSICDQFQKSQKFVSDNSDHQLVLERFTLFDSIVQAKLSSVNQGAYVDVNQSLIRGNHSAYFSPSEAPTRIECAESLPRLARSKTI